MYQGQIKKIIMIGIMIALLGSMSVPVYAKETDKVSATTMRLTQTEGTVEFTNADGARWLVKDGAKLYDGYGINTAIASYAYISLDNTKAIKLDQCTKANIKKDGKKLEISLLEGQLFLNVTAPLTIDESLQLRTSDQVTGIRGTSLCLSKPKMGGTKLQLLDGSIQTIWIDPDGLRHEQTVKAGEQLVIDQSIATVTPILTENIPPFAATEIMQNPELLLKVEAGTSFTGAQIGQSASLLAETEAVARKANEALQPVVEPSPQSPQDQIGTPAEEPTPPVPQDEYFTVTFEVDKTGVTPPPQQRIKKGGKATKPVQIDFTEEGVPKFIAFWRNGIDITEEYDFSTPITQNTTLYAQWVMINA